MPQRRNSIGVRASERARASVCGLIDFQRVCMLLSLARSINQINNDRYFWYILWLQHFGKEGKTAASRATLEQFGLTFERLRKENRFRKLFTKSNTLHCLSMCAKSFVDWRMRERELTWTLSKMLPLLQRTHEHTHWNCISKFRRTSDAEQNCK